MWILRCGDRIGHELDHCPLSLRLAHHGAVWLYLVRAIFFGSGHSGNPSPIAASSDIDLRKDDLRVPLPRKLLHRFTRAKAIQNRAAQGRSCGRRLNGIFAESARCQNERQDKTKPFHGATLSQISDASDKTQSLPPTQLRKYRNRVTKTGASPLLSVHSRPRCQFLLPNRLLHRFGRDHVFNWQITNDAFSIGLHDWPYLFSNAIYLNELRRS